MDVRAVCWGGNPFLQAFFFMASSRNSFLPQQPTFDQFCVQLFGMFSSVLNAATRPNYSVRNIFFALKVTKHLQAKMKTNSKAPFEELFFMAVKNAGNILQLWHKLLNYPFDSVGNRGKKETSYIITCFAVGHFRTKGEPFVINVTVFFSFCS